MDVIAWLSRLGLEQYEQALRENDVEAEVLPELTADEQIAERTDEHVPAHLFAQ